ncbi:MAG TPA: condensation domain-containing protein, partial [Pyrinomonadaceae bacterium]|nr:condensation domain-containing protein [Pyrinomonadaceae bacterium]
MQGNDTSSKKQKLLSILLEQNASGFNSFPLSFAQQRLWFFERFEPGNPVYHINGAIRLKGSLNIDALSRSLQEIIRRHEILRTTILENEGQPFQVIHPSADIPLPVVDLRSFPEAERETRLRELAAEEMARPFDLTTGPLLR